MASEPVRVEIQWPSGTRQIVENVKANQVVEVTEKCAREIEKAVDSQMPNP